MLIFSTDAEGWAPLAHSSFGPIDPRLIPFLAAYASVGKFLALGAYVAVGVSIVAEVFFMIRVLALAFLRLGHQHLMPIFDTPLKI